MSTGGAGEHGITAQPLQVVGSLPEHLLLPVLSAALRSMPPTVNMADATNAQYALKALIARLPERLHPLALQAHDPDVVHRRSFSALLADTPSAAAITEALSRACASHLTSLSLSCSMLPAGVHPIYDSAIDRRDFYVQAALQATFAPVASLTALRELQFVVFSHPRMLRDFLSQEVPAALAPALAQLTSLTSLTVRCHTHNGAAVGEVAACLPALRALRALDLSHCGAKPLHGADAPLQRLADALPAVTAVTHLCLTGNPLGNRGWEGLAAAAAALPLQALDLCSCCLCGEWDLCGGVPPDPDAPRPFAALRSLGLSNNVIDRVGAVTAQTVPQLTRVALVLPHSLRGAPVHAQALEAVAAAATPPLEVLCVGPLLEDLQLELAGDCLERCRRLRSVSLSWATHTSAALPRIFRNLFSLPWLQEVSLECAEVTPDVAAISQCTRLSHLALRHVVCAAQNSHLLTSMLAPLGLLRCLHVDVRGSADNAAVDAVALGVRTLTLLTKLHLIHSGMRPDLLAEALTGLTGLEHLELGDHPLWAAGVTAVAEVSRRMHHMAFLALGLGQGEEGLPALVAALPMMRGLRRLRVAGVGESGRAAVLQALPPGVESVQT